MSGGYTKEALAWRDWLLRAAAGEPDKLQIMYGIGGERRLDEYELPWLPGYEGSTPVRVGNAASEQFQLDVYGETLASLSLMRGVAPPDVAGAAGTADEAWKLELALLDFLEGAWHQPDDGLWEMRGERQHFTHSKVMAWLGFASAVLGRKQYDLPGPIDRWRQQRDEIKAQVLDEGFNPELNSFTQAYGSKQLDAALLQIPPTGFLPATDERMIGTVAAIERGLDPGRIRAAVPLRSGRRRSASGRGRVPSLLVLARGQLRRTGARQGRARAVRQARRDRERCRVSSPRSTTRSPSASSATSPRRSRTSRSSRARLPSSRNALLSVIPLWGAPSLASSFDG